VPDPVSYTGVLPIGESTVVHLARLLEVERRRRGTRRWTSELSGRGTRRCWCCVKERAPDLFVHWEFSSGL
jgi:hypothetical protein